MKIQGDLGQENNCKNTAFYSKKSQYYKIVKIHLLVKQNIDVKELLLASTGNMAFSPCLEKISLSIHRIVTVSY